MIIRLKKQKVDSALALITGRLSERNVTVPVASRTNTTTRSTTTIPRRTLRVKDHKGEKDQMKTSERRFDDSTILLLLHSLIINTYSKSLCKKNVDASLDIDDHRQPSKLLPVIIDAHSYRFGDLTRRVSPPIKINFTITVFI